MDLETIYLYFRETSRKLGLWFPSLGAWIKATECLLGTNRTESVHRHAVRERPGRGLTQQERYGLYNQELVLLLDFQRSHFCGSDSQFS